jgi:hypothetical protein
MKKYACIWFLIVCFCGLFISPVWSEEAYTQMSRKESPSGEKVFFDLIAVRPLGIVACALGIVGSVIALPFAITKENRSNIYNGLIADPFAFTFARPLGENIF